MRPPTLFWTLGRTEQKESISRTVRSFRECGCNERFIVLTEEEVPGAECHDVSVIPRENGFDRIVALKAGISRLDYEVYVWIEPGSVFFRRPIGILNILGNAPVFALFHGREDGLVCSNDALQAVKNAGVFSNVLWPRSDFWILRRSAVDVFFRLVQEMAAKMKEGGSERRFDVCFAFAINMLIPDREMYRESMWKEIISFDECKDYNTWVLRSVSKDKNDISLVCSYALTNPCIRK